jgi:subtilisin family serine protease
MLVVILAVSSVAGAAGPPAYVPGEVLVRFRPTTRAAERASLRSGLHATVLRSFPSLGVEHLRLDGMTVEQAIERFGADPRVAYVEPNYELHADRTPNDPLFPRMWGLANTGQTGGNEGADIHATSAWDVFTGDSTLLIGAIDSGVDYLHPDLVANIWTNPGEIEGNGIDDDGNGYVDDVHGYDFPNHDGDPMDDNGHGTHTAGTIAATGSNGTGVTGVCWRAKIVAIKFLNASGSGTVAGAIEAIQYAIRVGCRVTSNSWGGSGYSNALRDAIGAAGDAGQLFVAAAGNSARDVDADPNYPSGYDLSNILSVAATDAFDQLAPYSNYGATTVDLAAPGSDILSTFPGNRYALISGTSMAAPLVTGVVALAMGRFPGTTSLAIRDLVLRSVDPLPQLAGLCATGGRLNAFVTLIVPDSLPPGAIRDLRISGVASNSLQLAWTATGDDGDYGRASRYEIRRSTEPLTEATFGSATPVPGSPDPSGSGESESLEAGGLAFSTTYYFAVRALDELLNAGPISNVVSATTLGIPHASVDPESLAAVLHTGTDTLETLTLANAGEGTLDFHVPPPLIAFARPPVFDPVPVLKGMDGEAGVPVAEAHGGPDGGGYRWVDSSDPSGPAFAWVDAASLGSSLALTGDDNLSAPVDLGFDFPYYGRTFRTLRVCTNGFVTFSDVVAAFGNQPLPNPAAPSGILAPFWDDLDFSQTRRVYTWGDQTHFVIEFLEVPHYQSGGPYTFEIILEATGEIRYQYLSMGNPRTSATVGQQSPARDLGLTIAFNGAYVRDSLVIRTVPVRQWATVSPESGRLSAGQSIPLAVRFDATGMVGGTFRAEIALESNDPAAPDLRLPLALHVIGAPDLATSPDTVDFDDVFVGGLVERKLTILNVGTDTLHVSSLASANPDVVADVSAFSLVRLNRRDVVLRYRPTAEGVLAGTLEIASDDPDTPLRAVALRGRALPAPQLASAPESISVRLATAATVRVPLQLTNRGGSALDFRARAEAVGAPRPAVQGEADNRPVAKGGADVLHGVTPFGAGGPDGFGYTWRDSRESGGPAFAWEDVSRAGTLIELAGDDVLSAPIPIGFHFPFYGADYDSLRVGSNGFLTFTGSSVGFSNTTLPNNGVGVPENLIAAFWDDLVFSGTARAWWWHDATRLVVQFQDVPRFAEPDRPNTFEVVLEANGAIETRWLFLRGASVTSATVGIQNQARSDGLQVVFNAPYLGDSLAVRISPPASWVKVTPRSGTIPAGGTADLGVTLDAAGLFGGAYAGRVHLESNDPLATVRDIPVSLAVTGVAALVLEPSALDFGTVSIGEPRTLALDLRNAGSDTLRVTKLACSAGAITVDLDHLTLAPFAHRVVNVTYSPELVGPLAADLVVRSDDPAHPEVRVALNGAGAEAPVLVLEPATLAVPLATTLGVEASMRTRTVLLRNAGGNELAWRAQARLGVGIAQGAALEVEGAKAGPATPGARGAAGPDAGGYRWLDSDEPGGPVFAWLDIRALGTPLALDGDDQSSAPIALPFPFPFYGNSFDSLRVCTNGYVSFTSALATYTNAPLPNAGAAAPENLIAAFWDDQDFRPSAGQARAYVWGDTSRCVIAFHDVPHLDVGGPYTYQIELDRDGTIELRYLSMPGRTTEATIGIQNADRTTGLQVAYNASYVHDRLCTRFTRRPPWLAIVPDSGRVAPGTVDTLQVRLNAEGESEGELAGEIRITSSDLAHLESRVPVHAHVGVAPAQVRFTPRRIGARHLGRDVNLELRVPGRDPATIAPASVRLNQAIGWDREQPPRIDGAHLVLGFATTDLLTGLPAGGIVPVTVTGEVEGETWFTARDTLRIVRSALVNPATLHGWGSAEPVSPITAEVPVPLEWREPEGANPDRWEIWWSADDGATWSAASDHVETTSFSWTPPGMESAHALLEISGWRDGQLESAWLSQPFVLLRPNLGGPGLPVRLALRIAGPNPAPGEVTFDLALPAAAEIEVHVYDVRGARIAELARGTRSAGIHHVNWNGRDGGGRAVPAGVYFVRARAGGHEVMTRVALMR